LKRESGPRREPPTVLRAVKLSEGYLSRYNVESPRLNAERLLAKALDCSRMDLYLNFDKKVGEKALETYRRDLARRASRYPLQYITGETEFFSLPFRVEEGVFIPRQETELLVDRAEDLLGRDSRVRFVEFGVGSGIVAGTLAARNSKWTGVAFDVSPGAVGLARENFRSLGVGGRILSFVASGFDAINSGTKFDLLISNPPYVKTGDIDGLQKEVADHENRTALDGGEDGMRFYPELVGAGCHLLRKGGVLVMEIADGMASKLAGMLRESGFEQIECAKDYSGLERVVTSRKRTT